jgi:hypothetical protein
MAKRKPKVETMIDPGRYDVVRIRDKSGKLRTSRGNGDAVANAMLIHKAGGGDVDAIVRANKLTERMKPHMKKPAGQFRMTLGVMLRGLVNHGTPVRIGSIVVKSLKQRVALPKVEKLNGKKPAKKAHKAAPRKRHTKSHSVDALSQAA